MTSGELARSSYSGFVTTLVAAAMRAADAKLGLDPVVLDMRELIDSFDALVVASGRNDRQVRAIDVYKRQLLTRPLLEAISATDPVVLLIDEVDRVELETEALLLEILSEYQVSIPEMGTVRATQIPMVFLTSNNTRELSEALKRRCLYLYVAYPDVQRERDIILARVPGISSTLAEQIAQVVRSLRSLDLKKSPSVCLLYTSRCV